MDIKTKTNQTLTSQAKLELWLTKVLLTIFLFLILTIGFISLTWGQTTQNMYWTFNESTNNCNNNVLTSSPINVNISGSYSLTEGCSATVTGTSTSGSSFISVATPGNAIRNVIAPNSTEYWYFTLSGADIDNLSNIQVYFQQRRSRTGSTYTGTDYTSIQYSLDDGNTYIGSQALTPGNQNAWVNETFDFSEISGATSIILRIRWAQAGNSCNVDIDNFQVQATLTPTCPTITATVESKTDISCFSNSDGKITVSATGGTAPYTFSSNDGVSYVTGSNNPAPGQHTFEGLLANVVYKIRVKDASGCESPSVQ